MSRSAGNARLGGGTLAALSLGAVVVFGLGAAPGEAGRGRETQPIAGQPAGEQPVSDRVVVFFRDGRRVEGRLVRADTAEVVLEIAGIETVFNRAELLRVDPVPPVEEYYKTLRAVIADDDIEQLLLLIDWLRDREAFDLALRELGHVLAIDPVNPDAQRLKLQLESTLALRAAAAAAETGSDGGEQDPGDQRPAVRRPDFPMLTPDQINLLKVYEVDLKDPPRMSVDQETIRDLVAAFEGHELIPPNREGRAALERRSPSQILELMFRLKARAFYTHVRVEGEPRPFRLFRENVHRAWLVNSCATSACHGGQQAGRLWLNNTSENAEKTIYTNFLILERYRLADGTPLINYQEPGKSPLLQMALPREDSLYPHPLVSTSRTATWQPVIGSTDDRRFIEALEWVNAMYRPRPAYPVTYEPPAPAEGVPAMPDEPIGER